MATQQARIIPLPSAASSPVIQPKRRGRYPKKVINYWVAKQHQVEKTKAWQLQVEVARLNRVADKFMDLVIEHRGQARDLQAQLKQGVRV